MGTSDKVGFIVAELKNKYEVADCALEYQDEPYKLLILARLSAQCTDERVNAVSQGLFKEFKSLEEFAGCDLGQLERAIYSCGLHRTKARNIKDMCAMLLGEFGGEVPEDMSDLLRLPGVGRKIANLIRGDIFGLPAIVADTHCIRVSNRLGLCDSDNPLKVERRLLELIPAEESNAFCHRLVFFGREYCRAQSPRCGECFLAGVCEFEL